MVVWKSPAPESQVEFLRSWSTEIEVIASALPSLLLSITQRSEVSESSLMIRVISIRMYQVFTLSLFSMAASSPDQNAPQDPLFPMAYHVTLTEQQIAMVKELTANYSRLAMYGHVVGFSPSRTKIRDSL